MKNSNPGIEERSLPRSRSVSRHATLLLRDEIQNGCEGEYEELIDKNFSNNGS